MPDLHEPSTPRIFVTGYDGSVASRAALSHALDRAGEDGRVVVVHACTLAADGLGGAFIGSAMELALARGEEVLRTLTDADPRALPGAVDTELVVTDPASALTAIARKRDADAIVIGTRGFGRARALLGSVAHELIHKAECPVTVIPERAVLRDRMRAGAAHAAAV